MGRFVKAASGRCPRLAQNARMRRRSVLLATALAAFTAAVFPSATHVIALPDDYRRWTHVRSRLVIASALGHLIRGSI